MQALLEVVVRFELQQTHALLLELPERQILNTVVRMPTKLKLSEKFQGWAYLQLKYNYIVETGAGWLRDSNDTQLVWILELGTVMCRKNS